MLSTAIHHFATLLHTIAPAMIIILTITAVMMIVMGNKWKKQDPERWNRKY